MEQNSDIRYQKDLHQNISFAYSSHFTDVLAVHTELLH